MRTCTQNYVRTIVLKRRSSHLSEDSFKLYGNRKTYFCQKLGALYHFCEAKNLLESSKILEGDYEARFQTILDEHEVKFPLPMSQIHYKNVERLKFLKSNGVLFVDIPFHEDENFLRDENVHAVKIYDSPDNFSYVPSTGNHNYAGLFSWREFDRVIVVEDEWDALCLEPTAARIQKGVLPISGAENSSLFKRTILEMKKEIIIWPGQLVAKYPDIFEDLDDSKITTVSSSIPRPKHHRSTLTLLNVLIRETGDVVNLGANMARSFVQSQTAAESIKFTRFSMLNENLGGLRKGELTLFSGHTGKGKTTFLSEYSIDLALNGAKTLWCSFEMKLEALQNMQAMQLCQKSSEDCQIEYEFVQEKLGNLGILALNSEPGSMDPNELVDKLKELIENHRIDHIIIDNMQFLIFGTSSDDAYMSQDNTIRMLRELATFTDVHVTVICHPRKTSNVSKKDGYSFLTEYDLSGRARSVQEADNVIILQTSQDIETGVRKDWIQIHKCRHGEIGKFGLKYNRDTKTYLQESDWPYIFDYSDGYDDFITSESREMTNTVDFCLPDRRVDRLKDFLDEESVDLFLEENDTLSD
ncbi:Oidioi.mRNA.OKI2018_I69.chr2.g6052.t1.cds [Oikopleura dioica]|uniref:Oidioi.mRNA.OKI2018_I69.chr2.g6052.t1.cds n=1 Tax=Oikopleura dioica TaxID=34765 RepID=A0ABN7T5P6_OIKDI|nr:Oidioi.mRNA.OKI2018_I69.chr2.g6052.t1.cds [Oikopleura dioica]